MKTIRFNRLRITLAGSRAGNSPGTLASLFKHDPGQVNGPLGGRGAVTVSELAGIGPVVVKQYRRGGLLAHVVKTSYARLGKTRGRLEFELLEKVRSLGVNAPEPVAYAVTGNLIYRAWLVTRLVEGARTLAEIALENPDSAVSMMDGVTRQVRILIQNKIHHVDFHPGNVIVDRCGKIFLIDFDKGRAFRGGKKRLAGTYISRWERAVKKHRLPKALVDKMESGLG